MGAANPTIERSRARASDPANNGVAFTGTADVTLTTHSRAVYIASDGNLTVDFVGDGFVAGATNVTFENVKAGTILPIRISKVYDTGTTVSGVVLL